MANATCSIDACERPPRARGMCSRHYAKWYKENPEAPRRTYSSGPRLSIAPLERIKLYAPLDAESGCWIWQRSIQANGYARMTVKGERHYVHRLAYELLVGPIPEGLHLDHLCRNRACCNPAHLEPVTCLENVRRGQGNGSQTHCPQGHPYEGDNLVVYAGHRQCIACRTIRNRARGAA